MADPIFRFAPSPNGYLHLGHAYAALYNQKICKTHQGIMRLRFEDTDLGRCSSEFESAIYEDLAWIGFEWRGEVRRQSDYLEEYARVLDDLADEKLAYPAFKSRSLISYEISRWEERTGKNWPRDPDGGLHYPVGENLDTDKMLEQMMELNPNFAWRLDIERAVGWLGKKELAILSWQEIDWNREDDCISSKTILGEPELWGDIVLGRKEIPASYHLASVIDDHIQGVTHVVRGQDLFAATVLHRLLQKILGYYEPVYCHHKLLVDETGQKFSKRHGDMALRELRAAGLKPEDIHKMIGLQP